MYLLCEYNSCCCVSFDDIQKSEWKLHRLECDALTMLDNDKRKSVTPSIRLMVKLYIRRKLQDEKANLKNNGLVLLSKNYSSAL